MTHDELQILIELLEETICLWDIFLNDYTEGEQKEKAYTYTELSEHSETTSADVKSKINALKAQLGKEIAKESKTKSGKATSEQYIRKLMFYDQLQSSLPILASTKTEITLALPKAI